MLADIFNNAYSKEYVLRYSKSTKSYKFNFCLCGPIQNLVKLGIRPRKTYEDDDYVFSNIPDRLKKHFIRGFYDGDGSICFSNNKTIVGFVSLNNKLLSSIMTYIHANGFLGSLRMDGKYTRICFAGNPSCKAFLDWLYKDASIYMERKYKKYIQIPDSYYQKYRYTGIYKNHNKFLASIYYQNNNHCIGSFPSVYDAINAYNKEAIRVGKPTQEYKGEELYNE